MVRNGIGPACEGRANLSYIMIYFRIFVASYMREDSDARFDA